MQAKNRDSISLSLGIRLRQEPIIPLPTSPPSWLRTLFSVGNENEVKFSLSFDRLLVQKSLLVEEKGKKEKKIALKVNTDFAWALLY